MGKIEYKSPKVNWGQVICGSLILILVILVLGLLGIAFKFLFSETIRLWGEDELIYSILILILLFSILGIMSIVSYFTFRKFKDKIMITIYGEWDD